MTNLRNLTILHSNDMHGDFLAEQIDDELVGGVSLLSGYLNKARQETVNLIYAIAGDMFRGSIIDSEFKGVSTIDIMNMLAPDVVTLGNHELDYGIAHLLFLERCAKFPIVNANLYIKTTGRRLFKSHCRVEVGGMRILFIGILTEAIMASAKQDTLLGTFVNVNEAAHEVGKICNNYRTKDVDLTVLLTHIGYEEDIKLAGLLDPDWGVDIIIGGHSHTYLTEPTKVNDVLIVQAGTGTDAIGRFDLVVNVDTDSVVSYDWKLVPINDDTCPRDEVIEQIISTYKNQTDEKYERVVTRFPRELTHPRREQETEIGNLFADAFHENLDVDIVFLGSGSIRKETLGPVVTLQDLMEIFPFDDKVFSVELTGAELKHAFEYICRDEFLTGETEFYQVSGNVHVEYDCADRRVAELTVNGREVADDDIFSVALQEYHFNNMRSNLDLSDEEVGRRSEPKCVSTSCFDIIEEYLSEHPRATAVIENRIFIPDRPY